MKFLIYPKNVMYVEKSILLRAVFHKRKGLEWLTNILRIKKISFDANIKTMKARRQSQKFKEINIV